MSGTGQTITSNSEAPAAIGSTVPSPTETLRARVRELQLPRDSGRSRGGSRGLWLLVLLLTGIVVLLLWWIWLLLQSPLLDEAETKEKNAETSQAETIKAKEPTVGIVLESKGYVIPAHQILVSPKVSGMIISLHVEEGLLVKKGDVLAVLESNEYQAEHDRVLATIQLMKQRYTELAQGNRPEEILQSTAELAEAKETLDELQTTWKRQEKMFKEQATTESATVTAESRYQAQKKRVERLQHALNLMKDGPRQERIEAALAELHQAEADYSKAKWRLDNCTIRAPISGTILKKNAEEGNIVNPVAFNGSFSVCDIADLSDLEVDLAIQERDISRVYKGQRCVVRIEAYPDRAYPGHVARLMPIADRAKGAVPVRVKVVVPSEEEGLYLKPEMGATVAFYHDQ